VDPTLPSFGVVGALVVVIGYVLRYLSAREAEHRSERAALQQRLDTANERADARAAAETGQLRAQVTALERKLEEIRDPGRATYRRHLAQQEEGGTDER
jgi:hypothetical protein